MFRRVREMAVRASIVTMWSPGTEISGLVNRKENTLVSGTGMNGTGDLMMAVILVGNHLETISCKGGPTIRQPPPLGVRLECIPMGENQLQVIYRLPPERWDEPAKSIVVWS
jgi:hypothetical protein